MTRTFTQTAPRAPRTLVIGDLRRWEALRLPLPELEGLRFLDVADLTVEEIMASNPDMVISNLMVRDTDVTEIAHCLTRAGFSGRYRVVAQNVPDAEIITAEIAQISPSLDFEIIGLRRETPL